MDSARKRLKQTASARTMRRATAYARLAAKAWRNGEGHAASHYQATYLRLRAQALRQRERETR